MLVYEKLDQDSGKDGKNERDNQVDAWTDE